jgi:hypothetical protein
VQQAFSTEKSGPPAPRKDVSAGARTLAAVMLIGFFYRRAELFRDRCSSSVTFQPFVSAFSLGAVTSNRRQSSFYRKRAEAGGPLAIACLSRNDDRHGATN